MAIKTTEELLASVKERLGNDSSDEAIGFLEDITDTITDLNAKAKDTTDWKKKYEENDQSWRDKYRERFFNGGGNDDDDDEDNEPPKSMKRFEDLFTTK